MSQQLAYLEQALIFAGGSIKDDRSAGQTLLINGVVYPLSVIAAGSIFPRDARSLAWAALEARNAGRTPVVAAELVSEGAREFLRSQKIGYSDASGSLFLPIEGALVLVDRPVAKREKRVVKSVLSGRTSLAVHAMMSVNGPMKGVEVAALTGLSLGAVSAGLDKLDRMGWLSTEGNGPRKMRRLSDRRALLDHWKAVRKSDGPVPKEKFYVPGAAGPAALAVLVADAAARSGVEYMVSGPYGSQLHAPYLSSISQLVCRVPRDGIERLAAVLGARRVSEGWNLGLVGSEIPVRHPFATQVDGVWLGSPLVCWMDTVAETGRSPELADHLAEERFLAQTRSAASP